MADVLQSFNFAGAWGQTLRGEVYDVVSGRVEAQMADQQEPVSLAAAGIPPAALPRVQHADGSMRYQVSAATLQPAKSLHLIRCCTAVSWGTWRGLTSCIAGG